MRSERDVKKSSQAAAPPERGISTRPPWFVVAMAVVALLLGVFTTPDNLLAVGRLRWYLTEAGEQVRRATEIEIQLFRIACIGVSLLLFAWGWIAKSSFAHRVHLHEPRERGWVRSRKTLFNFSLFASLSCAALAVAYSATAERFLSPEQLSLINDEDGVIEYGTAFFFLATSVASVILARRDRARRGRVLILWFFALAFFFASGEEISWGQRLLGMETPELMKEKNIQSEINIHNMLGPLVDHFFLLGVLVYGILSPLLAWRFPFFHKLFDYVGLPIGSLGLAVGFLTATFIWVGSSLFGQPSGYRVEEMRELLSALCLFLLMVEVWRKAPEDRSPAPAAAPA